MCSPCICYLRLKAAERDRFHLKEFFKLKHCNYKLVHIIKPKNEARSVSLNVSPIHEAKS